MIKDWLEEPGIPEALRVTCEEEREERRSVSARIDEGIHIAKPREPGSPFFVADNALLAVVKEEAAKWREMDRWNKSRKKRRKTDRGIDFARNLVPEQLVLLLEMLLEDEEDGPFRPETLRTMEATLGLKEASADVAHRWQGRTKTTMPADESISNLRFQVRADRVFSLGLPPSDRRRLPVAPPGHGRLPLLGDGRVRRRAVRPGGRGGLRGAAAGHGPAAGGHRPGGPRGGESILRMEIVWAVPVAH